MKMYNDYLLIKADDDSRTAGGLYVPENAKKRTRIGTVVASCEVKDRVSPLEGDRVLYDVLGGFDPVELSEGDEKIKYDLVALRQIIMSLSKD